MKFLFGYIARLKRSSFARSAGKLVTGTAAAQFISIATAPILYRIYAKEDYGTLGLYMAITGVLGTFSTLQYTQAVLIEQEDKDAWQVLWLVRAINLTLTIVSLLIVLFGNVWIASSLNNPEVAVWLYMIPLSVFFSGQNELYRIWANRKKEYDIMMWNAILTALLVPVVSISLGLWSDSPLGLFLGLLASQVIPALFLGYQLHTKGSLIGSGPDLSFVKAMATRYVKFPVYSLPADFINRLSNQLPVFMLTTYAGPAVVGSYNLAMRMLGIPINLIGSAVGEVFKQKATEEYHVKGNCEALFVNTLKSLLAIATVPFFVILLFGPSLFGFVFGEEWREAGVFAQVLSVIFFFRLFVSPLSFLFSLAGKQKLDFFWHILMLVFSFLSFYVGFEFLNSVEYSLLLFSCFYATIYIIYLYNSYKFAQNETVV